MHANSKELADRYAAMSETELLELARSYDSLTEIAQSILRLEFDRRKLDPPFVEEVSELSFQELVTLWRYRDLPEAIIARSTLESSGIPAYLFDENMVRLEWQVSNLLGGVRLQVRVEDQAAASEILNQPMPESFTFNDNEEFVQPHCPVCNSTNISFEGASRSAALVSLYALSLPAPLGPETWICNQCNTRWEETD